MELDVSGYNELLRKIRKMANGEEIEKRSVTKAGEHLKKRLEANVYQFGLKRRTGKMEDSVMISEYKDGKLDVGISNQHNEAFYAYFHEIGTSKMPARPVLRPLFVREKKNLERIIAEETRKRLGI